MKKKIIHNSDRDKIKLKPASVDTQPEDVILCLTMYTAQVTQRQGWEWGRGTQENKHVNCAPGDACGFLCPGLYDRSSGIDYSSKEYSTSPGTGHPSFVTVQIQSTCDLFLCHFSDSVTDALC